MGEEIESSSGCTLFVVVVLVIALGNFVAAAPNSVKCSQC